MIDSIFAKAILSLASILSIVAGPNYIKIGPNNLTFDFKTGENYPIYYFLNVQNVGPEKERFEISSDVAWVSVYREGTGFIFVELSPQAYINFVVEIHPERLPDGINKAEINLRVLDIDSLVSQEVVLDQAEVFVIVNKNFVPTPSPTIVISSIPSPTSTQSPSTTPLATPIQSPTAQETIQSSQLNSILKQLQSLIDSLRVLIQSLFQ